jgi:hypothetical protein
LHQGVRIKNFTQFKEMFGGFTSYGYLAYAVYGFFNAGGRDCIVVRTAHLPRVQADDATEEQKNSAARAALAVADIAGQPCLDIRAQSEGTWGNLLKVKLWYVSTHTTPLTGKPDKAQQQETPQVEVEDGAEFEAGDWVSLRSRNECEYLRIVRVEGNNLYFDAPLKKSYKEADQVFCERIFINLLVIQDKKVEEYLYLSPNPFNEKYFVDYINAHSQLVQITGQAAAGENPGLPAEVYYQHLEAGRNGILGLTPGDFIGYFKGLHDNKGIGIFEMFDDVSLLVAPDVLAFQELVFREAEQAKAAIYAVQRALVDQCEKLGDRFAILDTPHTDDPLHILKWRQQFDTKAAAMYYPMVEMRNPEDLTGLTSLMVPPSGHIAGAYAHCEMTEGIYRAPANIFMNGVVGVSRIIEDDEYEILYPRGINIKKYVPGRGVKIWGARTLASDLEWRYINVRRTFSAIRDALGKGVGWAVFETNDENLRKRIVRHVYAFLLDLWRSGYMKGTTPEEGFYIRCDDELNPQEEIDKGRITVQIGVSIARPAEFLVVKITANTEDSIIDLEND